MLRKLLGRLCILVVPDFVDGYKNGHKLLRIGFKQCQMLLRRSVMVELVGETE